ncbi:MAG: hypothetical protein ABFD54_02340 [Armatimonadota bacterium]|nr:hypothetical protein [bacterium]
MAEMMIREAIGVMTTHLQRMRRVFLSIIVFLLLLATVWTRANADTAPVVGPETPVCPTYGPVPGNQDGVEIAGGSNGYLAVWQDTRSQNGSDIFGCRLGPNGEVLDNMGISISTVNGDQIDPSVAWNGQEYLVVWTDKRESLSHIYAARVRPTGEVLDPGGILLSGTVANQIAPKVASDTSGCLVVWQDTRGSSNDIYGCAVSSVGIVGRIYGIVTHADNEESPALAYNGSSYMVIWRDYRNSDSTDTDIYGCRVSKLGIRMTADALISSAGSTAGAAGAQLNPRICAIGTSFMAVWEDMRVNKINKDIYGARINYAGTLVDKSGIAICTASGDDEMPCVAYDGSKLLVSWRSRSDRYVKATRMSIEGGILDPVSIKVSGTTAGSTGIGVAAISGKFAVGWGTLNASNTDAVAAAITDSGSVVNKGGTTISIGLDNEQDYSVVFDGNVYTVVWSQPVSGVNKILGAQISASGEPLNEVPVNITSELAGNQIQPSIAWNGSKYLVVWSGSETYTETARDIRGYLLDSSLNTISTETIPICTNDEDQVHPCATSNNNNFIVLWEDIQTNTTPYTRDIYGAIISSTGTIPASMSVNTKAGNQLNPRVASDGTNYFAVWEDYRNGTSTGSSEIYGISITSAGVVQNTTGILFPATSINQTVPDVCFGGGNYFVTWSDYYAISGCRITPAGVKLDTNGISINTGPVQKTAPSVSWNGSAYRVVWEDYRSSQYGNSDIYFTTVGADGAVVASPETALVSDMYPQLKPRVFGSGMLFYSRLNNFVNCTMAVTLTDQETQEVDRISVAKDLPAGSLVRLSGKIVTAVFPGFFYIEESDRSSGIKVVSSEDAVVGTLVDVMGTLSVCDGERQINASESTALGVASDPLRAIGIRGDWIGGGKLNSYTPGITGGYGANNIGLLITTWGKVVANGANSFTIEVSTGTNVKVKSGTLTQPLTGKFVVITGISTCDANGGTISRAIRLREQEDIVVIK